MKRKTILMIFVLFTCVVMGQSKEREKLKIAYETGLSFGASSKDELPFWLTYNKFGLVPKNNYGMWDFTIKKLPNKTQKFDWDFGVMGASTVSKDTDIRLRDYYVGARYEKLKFYVGAKAVPVIYGGLSSSNGRFIASSNARPYPRAIVSLDYIDIPFLKGWVQFKGAYSEGVMIDDRYVDNVRLHYKNLYFKAGNEKLYLEAGINHYVQWAGNSPSRGKLASSFGAYKDMIFAKKQSEYDELGSDFDKNRVGNHIGMLDLHLHYTASQFLIDAYRQVIFEDSSGHNFFNRDALWGVYLERNKEKPLVKSVLVEYYFTKYQSGDKAGKKADGSGVWTGRDNYFNNSTYRSGWTNYGFTIGSPFFTERNGKDYALGVDNNRIIAYHMGLAGFVTNSLYYKAMFSITRNYGTYSVPMDKNQRSAFLELGMPLKKIPLNISCGVAVDNGELLNNNIGAFLKISTNGLLIR